MQLSQRSPELFVRIATTTAELLTSPMGQQVGGDTTDGLYQLLLLSCLQGRDETNIALSFGHAEVLVLLRLEADTQSWHTARLRAKHPFSFTRSQVYDLSGGT
jgi:hypothetical protein